MNSTDGTEGWNKLIEVSNIPFGNITLESETKHDTVNREYSVFSFSLRFIECVLSLPIVTANGLTLATVIRHARKTPRHVSVGFLACADLLAGFTPWFFLAMYLNTDLLHDKVFCTFSVWFEAFLVALNPTAIFIIACERCLLITNWQLHRKHLSVRKHTYMLPGCTFLSFIINTGSLLTGDVLPMYGSCYWALDTNKELDYILSLPMYTIVLVIIMYCNSCIIFLCGSIK